MSKRKHKKYTYPRQNKTEYIQSLTIPQYKDLLISYDKGQVRISDKNGNLLDLGPQSMTRSYQGQSKEHVVAKATNLGYVTDQVGSWAENFDYIFAIDTNSHPQKCNDFFCSVAFVYYGKVQKINDYERNMEGIPYLIIDWYHPCKVKIELISWMETIKYLQKFIPSNKKVGIVIDSELGNLEEYNNRTIPVFEKWYLPDNYTLIYATADSSDEWCNKMIKQCDKSASIRLNEIIADPKLKQNIPGCVAPIGYISVNQNVFNNIE